MKSNVFLIKNFVVLENFTIFAAEEVIQDGNDITNN